MPDVRRNLALYPWYVGGLSCFAWMPVFFLYQSSLVTLPEVLALEAIYYAAVVALEVPSGYFSDRVGRRPTLILAAAALVASYGLFAASDTFPGLAAAQVLLAMGLAFNSGTDTSFHLASLTDAGREQEYGEREARLGSLSFGLGAAAALGGGALGMLDLRLAYALSALGAAVALGAALGFKAPTSEDGQQTQGFGAALGACARLTWSRPLGWLMAVSVTATVINHIPYEFYQPYLERLPEVPWPEGSTPLVAGLHTAAVQLVAAPVARLSARSVARLGLMPNLLLSLVIQAGLIGLMALAFHPLIAALVVGRSIPRALQDAPLRAAVAPRVPAHLRATYLSIQSLAGRLGFAALLTALSAAALELSGLLTWSAGVASALVLGVFVLAMLLRPGFAQPPQPDAP